ncbi:hypothetical protein Bca52824_070474 [Brassica carinata]|uniref:Uncharacterized protein n=1 Tax=Brassica carinata TaxID=52824 RepID=A0A8X7Q6Z6_BRACI|nr:hypothetical protein Bca52824_070474 [Brassica carinata]
MEEGLPEADNLLRIKHKTEEEEEKRANGGVFNSLISNLIGTTTTVDDKSGENIQKSEDEDEKKKENSGAGILENIKSHLPDDIAVPTTEEASMLIHSVID